MVLLWGHRLGQGVGFRQHVAALAYAGRELEPPPLFPGSGTLEDIDVEVSKLGIIEILLMVRGCCWLWDSAFLPGRRY